MSAFRRSPLLPLLLLALLLTVVVAGQARPTHSKHSSLPCSPVHRPLFSQHRQYGQQDCADTLVSPPSSSPSSAPFPPSVQPDASWQPNQAIAVYVRPDNNYWYVALGTGVQNYQSHTLLKVINHVPEANVSLDSSYSIVTVLGNISHVFVQVYTGDIQATVVMTFDADTLEQVNQVTLSGPVLLSGVNAAGSLFVVAAVQSKSATLVDANTGRTAGTVNGGRTDIVLDAAALDATTDTVIIADSTSASMYGISFNNSVLWTIPLPADQAGVVSFAVDYEGRSFYIFMLATTSDEYNIILRYVQYDLATGKEVARYDIADNSIIPQAPFCAGVKNGQVVIADAGFGTVVQLSINGGAAQSTSFSRYPYISRLASIASVNGSSFTAYTIAPFVLHHISADGDLLKSTEVAPVDACGDIWDGPNQIDIDLQGNIYVPLCSLGVRVYSPQHELLHVIHTPNNSRPVGVAASPSGKYVYVIYSTLPRQYDIPLTQLYEVATGKFIANFTSSDGLGPDAIAVDGSDDSLWGILTYDWYHWSLNTTLLTTFDVALGGFQLAVDSQHRRLVIPANEDDGADRLEWYGMADGKLIKQFTYPTHVAAGAVCVTKDGVWSVAVEVDDGIWYFFRNDGSSTADQSKQQRSVEAAVLME